MQRTLRTLPAIALLALSFPLTAQVPQLWGVTTAGGEHGLGTIFHVNGDGSDFATVFSFDTLAGGSPEGGLCVANGRLYGMTTLYGAHNVGTLFSYDPGGVGFHKLLDFDMTNGGLAWAGMIRATDGLLYGATYQGGGVGGSIFRLDPATEAVTILHQLSLVTDGSGITDRLLQASDGALYGAAAYGGVNNAGTLFRYEPGTDTFTKLHDFDGTNGDTPYGALCQGMDGLLYGMTFSGGSQDMGVLYSIDPVSGTFTKHLDFIGTNGQSPWGSLVRAADGTLYGTTTLGGPASGSIFALAPETGMLTTLHSFNGLDGGLLFGAAIIGSDGALYGTSGIQGTFAGNVYRFAPATGTLTSLHGFTEAEGQNPRSELVEFGSVTGIAEQQEGPAFSVSPNPSSGAITVRTTDRTPMTLVLTDALGREVMRRTIAAERTTWQLGQPSGIYFLTLSTPGGRSTQRIIIE